MSSINNDITLSIIGTSTSLSTVEELIAPDYKAMKELTQTEYENLLQKALVEARKTIRESEVADPQTMLALLAIYGIQEVHALGFKPPSAMRAMAIKACSEAPRSTKGCLLQAKRELITAAREKGAVETKEDEADDVVEA